MNAEKRYGALTAYVIGYLVFLYGPVLLLPLFSFNNSLYITFPLKGFTFDWYRQMAGSDQLMESLQASLKVAVGVAVISTILGVLAAKALTRYYLPGRGPVTGFLMLPLVVPSLVLALALLFIMRRVFDVELSLYTVAAGHVMLCVPYSTLVMISRLEGFDKNLEEASFDLGESGWQTFWRITFPLAWPGIVSSLLLCFSASFDEYVVAAFLTGNETTMPVFIYSQLRFPQRLPGVLALGSCILVGSVVMVTLSEWIRRRGVQPQRAGQGLAA
jgi:spermidine/putrescine transport system permease protein